MWGTVWNVRRVSYTRRACRRWPQHDAPVCSSSTAHCLSRSGRDGSGRLRFEPLVPFTTSHVAAAWLIPNCATSRCHGGLDGGRFFLHRRGSKSEQVRYTNLLILERWNELEMPLVDYLDPGRSLLIQYGLPKNEARFPHPDVKGWSPVFSKGNPRLLRDAFGWMNSMYRPRSRYPVDYEAPIISTPDLPEPQSSDSPDDRRGR